MKWLFWLCVLGALHSYFIYPLLLKLVPKRVPGRRTENYAPRVSLIVACRNEERRLRHKIENARATRYQNKEILVASDASDDGSDAIVLQMRDAGFGVRLVRSPERRGKEYAQGLAIEAAEGEIIVFTDAGTDLPEDSIDELVASFADPQVGAVSSEDRFVSQRRQRRGRGRLRAL